MAKKSIDSKRVKQSVEPAKERYNMTPRKKAFAAALRFWRLKKGITQADLVRLTGLSRDNISRYCLGKSMPGGDNLDRLAKALGVTAVDLDAALAVVKTPLASTGFRTLVMTVSKKDPTIVRLDFCRAMKLSTANKVTEALSTDLTEDDPDAFD